MNKGKELNNIIRGLVRTIIFLIIVISFVVSTGVHFLLAYLETL